LSSERNILKKRHRNGRNAERQSIIHQLSLKFNVSYCTKTKYHNVMHNTTSMN